MKFNDDDKVVVINGCDNSIKRVTWWIFDECEQYVGINKEDIPVKSSEIRHATCDEIKLGSRIDGNNP